MKKALSRFLSLFSSLFGLLFLAVIAGSAVLALAFVLYGSALPDYHRLADYEPPVTSRFYSGDGRLLAEYATEKRVFVPITFMPKQLISAFVSAEDKKFYEHAGLDYLGIVRAVAQNIGNIVAGRRSVGASTITQQVAKNILLSSEQSLSRKIKEAITALRMEHAFSKDRIMELYLNEIYLGYGSYGVAMAALNYFNKSLGELTLAECAFLAALPKGPGNYDPARHYDAAVGRRDWVLGRMAEDGAITAEQAAEARAQYIKLSKRPEVEQVVDGDYFAEEVRRRIVAEYGSDAIYLGGLTVRTSVDSRLQEMAARALSRGIQAYDRAHGYRGAIARIEPGELASWPNKLRESGTALPRGWLLAAVLESGDASAKIGFLDGRAEKTGLIALADLKWARKAPPRDNTEGPLGPEVKRASDVLAAGDIVAAALKTPAKGQTAPVYELVQLPLLQGALIALDPHTGRVLAMQGGFSFNTSEYNRATQSRRQPGSAFKPFVYLTALANGYAPTSLILDAPFVYDQGKGLPKWKPENFGATFYGPATMRVGLERSHNLMTVRLAAAVGMDKVSKLAVSLGIYDNLPPLLSMSLGAGDTSPLRLAAAYAMLVNGGRRINPTFIDRIQDKTGKSIFRADTRPCQACDQNPKAPPAIPDARERLIDPIAAYQVVNILTGVINTGTGNLARIHGVPLAGKTGTSNSTADAWFMGMTADLVAGVFLGFDEPESLGRRYTGGVIAAPIFREFMVEALKTEPAVNFRRPPGVKLVRVDHKTGRPAQPGDTDVVEEAFPSEASVAAAAARAVLDGSAPAEDGSAWPAMVPQATEDLSGDDHLISAGGIY
ncbi:penicillin-binding protein 1A [Alphaproteobacteria bacterium]|nr:penicillin-binding protein 1A [Alphaproteobacteria bacterium]